MQRAYGLWLRSEAGRKNRHRVVAEHGSAEVLIDEIASEIATRTLHFRPIRRYWRIEPTNGKRRLIGIESVKQQVCDYVAVSAMEDFLHAKIGFYQVANITGKGQVFAARAIRRWVHDDGFHVHLDVTQCYPSISHDLVMRILKRHVRSDDVLYVARTLLATYGDGLDIGSYFSLRMAQLVLSHGYHHVEGLHKTRRGRTRALVSHQLWYMDDILLMSRDKRDLKAAVRSLDRYLATEMGLRIKPWKVGRVGAQEPIDIAGFVVRPDRTTIRAGTFLRARRTIRRYRRHPSLARARRVVAYHGWFMHSDSRRAIARNHITEATIQARAQISTSERGS